MKVVALGEVDVKIIIPEMLVALKLSSWSLAVGRGKDAMDIRLVLENVKILCPDLDNDFHNVDNEALFEKYSQNENGLWISIFGSRLQVLLNNNELSSYIRNLFEQNNTVNSLITDMNTGKIPDDIMRKALESLVIPLKDGLTLKPPRD
jgi:hypothetical protein